MTNPIDEVLNYINYNFVVLGVAGHAFEPGTYATVQDGKVVACCKEDAIGYVVDSVGPGCPLSLDLSCGHIFDSEEPTA